MLKKKILVEFRTAVEDCFVFKYFDTRHVITYVIQNKLFGFITYYTIKQSVPYNHGCTFDLEFSTNTRLKYVAKQDKLKARAYIIDYKNGKK